MEINIGSLSDNIKISFIGFLIAKLVYSIIPNLPESSVNSIKILTPNVVELSATIIFFISLYLFISGVWNHLRGIKNLNISIEVSDAVQHRVQDDYSCEFTFILNNKSKTATTVTKIEYSLPLNGSPFNNPHLNILPELPQIKAGSSVIIKDSFQYAKLSNKSYVEITFYHTYGTVQAETAINSSIS